ncbi:di-trans,poly-cis-decaprenylcistransferase [bacterium]|nr:di-trans,poly-cis-decaprenylcistransferase [bacterium]
MSLDSFIQKIDTARLPRHVAIIMDGNGRWATSQGLNRLAGHQKGVDRSEEIIDIAQDIGIGHLTLYAFSKENWNRPPEEVKALMELLAAFLQNKESKMVKNGIRFHTIGDMLQLPDSVQKIIEQVKQNTSAGKKMVLTLALSYGGRDELLRALPGLIDKFRQKGSILTEEDVSAALDTAGMPDPDLIIRTSGEHRISNFLLWQGAYAEYFFDNTLWPDFTSEHFVKTILDYQKRERRFGKTGEQVKN